MKKLILLIALFSLSGCTMFEKTQAPADELEMLTADCLKKNEGVDITVMPVPVSK